MANVLSRKINHGKECGGTRECALRTREVSLLSVANLIVILSTFLRLALGPAVIFFLLFKPGHPTLSITPHPPTSYRTITCASITSHMHLATPIYNILYFHSLLTFSLPVLCWFPHILFLFTLGNPWLKLSAFWLIALSTFSVGHCMKGLSSPTLRLNVVNCLSLFLITTLHPAPSHFIHFLRTEDLAPCLLIPPFPLQLLS